MQTNTQNYFEATVVDMLESILKIVIELREAVYHNEPEYSTEDEM
jgi:hypothetical protein